MDFPANRIAAGRSHRRTSRLVITALLAVVSLAIWPASSSASSPTYAWAWGNDDWGRLGTGLSVVHENEDFYALPSGVCAVGTVGQCPAGPYLTNVGAISAGGGHSLALLSDGTVVAWGENESGQLGDGTSSGPATCTFVHHEWEASRPCSATPVAVSGLSGVVAIAAGAGHSLALLSNGTVMAWGNNANGQLGDGTTKPHDVPVAVSKLSGVMAISAGTTDSLALLSDGTVMAWGGNASGELGDGTTTDRHLPVAVSGLSGVTAIAAADGGAHSLALLESGVVMAWGADGSGQLGDGTTEGSAVPVAVSALSGVAAIAAGGESSLARLGSGAVMSWGANGGGQLGIGGEGQSLAFSDVPVQVCATGVNPRAGFCTSGPFLTGVAAVSAGWDHNAALQSTGVASWGDGCSGQLGNGTGRMGGLVCQTAAFTPVATGGGLGDATLVSAGGDYSLAFGPPLPTVTNVSPNAGLDAGGESVTITGTELSEATAVHFGSATAPSFTVNSETSITAVSPAKSSGEVPVTVTTPAGTSHDSVTPGVGFFRYLATFPRPVVRFVKPNVGPAAGGTSVELIGSGFIGGGISVHFGSAAATSFTVHSEFTITAISPPGAGIVGVTVSTLGGTSASAAKQTFHYGVPIITGLSPSGGPTAGGSSVTVTGHGFGPGTTATIFNFGTTPATSVSCASTTTCTVVAPPHKAGVVTVQAKVGVKVSAKSAPAARFTYS